MAPGRVRTQERMWSADENKMLVIMIHSRESIWNSNCGTYKNRGLKERQWEEIANKTKHSVVDAKNRWNTIKSRYNSERKKVLTSRNKYGEFMYQSKFCLYEALQFLTTKSSSKKNSLEASTNTSDSFLEPSSISPEVETNNNYAEMCHEPVKKSPKLTDNSSVTTAQSLDSSFFTTDLSDLIENCRRRPVSEEWKKVFSDYIFCELDRYEYDDAQNLKKQLTMVCVNFQPAQ